ncbi:hypothetical protein BK816_01935 [Boudabousia tangfeifanii]|uniref:Serine aminopeptidase S33 domain-containing protein n=1 Tax=Boudabousia tangfeifanii TaxID=1912795 RepID=A0A1D9MIT0_9ACTO|nr:alpha/beta fold hydrolase [Boudabousia tangfeifanii]AOZ72204.1 hypothetical protein BK816_01935 [Boudabousia tangfeifanii]
MYLHGVYTPAKQPKAIALITHGYAEHADRYTPLVKMLTRHHISTYRYDHFGHGKSTGPRAQVNVNDLVRQHYRVRQQIQEQHQLPLFLIGHSMGGLITAASTLAKPDGVAGVVLTGPALGINPSLPGPVADALYEAGKLLPKIPASPFDPSGLSFDPKVVEHYKHDPLNYVGPVPLLTGSSMAALGKRVVERAPHWSPDTLIIVGESDEIVDQKAIHEFQQSAGKAQPAQPNVDLMTIPAAKHEVLNEAEGPVLMALIAEWISQRCQADGK